MEGLNVKIYMAVTRDNLQLPVAVADTVTELADILGVSTASIWSSLTYGRKHKRRTKFGAKRRYYCVEVDDDENRDG